MLDLKSAFDWLAQEPPRDRVGVPDIPRMLETVWGEIRDAVGHDRFDKALGPIRAGARFRAEDDHAWVQTHADKDESTANLTIELYRDELTLNLVGFFDGRLEKVRGWIGRGSGRSFLRDHPELELASIRQ